MSKRLTHEQQAFIEALICQTSDMLFKYAYRFLSYDPNRTMAAEDAVHDTYLRAMRHAGTLMKHDNPVGWLKLTLNHLLIDRYRKLPHIIPVGDVASHPVFTRQDVLLAMERWERQEHVDTVLDAVMTVLSEGEQRTFCHVYLQGATLEEAGQQDGLTRFAARSRVERSRKKLKKYFGILSLFLFVIRYIK